MKCNAHRCRAHDLQPYWRPCVTTFFSRSHNPQEAGMPRGDELFEEYRFSDRDDDVDDLGYGGGTGGSSYDDDDDEEGGGWMTHKDESDELWDSAEDADEDEEEGGAVEAVEEEEEEEDVFQAPRRAGRPPRPKPTASAS